MAHDGEVQMRAMPLWTSKLHDDPSASSPLSVADTAMLSCSPREDKRARAQLRVSPQWFPGLLSLCLTYLDGVALLKCELVAKEWHATAQDPALWAMQYSCLWRNGSPLPSTLLVMARHHLKRICRDRSTLHLQLSTRAMWWVHNQQTLRVHNVSLQRSFSRGCVESVRTDHALRPLGLSLVASGGTAPVYYYEATIRGCGSVGIARLADHGESQYYGAGSSSHVGWLPGSYGYHGDDGKIYWHDGTAPIGGYAVRYGPTWGDTRVLPAATPTHNPPLTTIGCGIDAARGRIFFTKNGVFLGYGRMRVGRTHSRYCGAVSLHHLGDTAELNLGRAAFTFDIEAYIAERAMQVEAAEGA